MVVAKILLALLATLFVVQTVLALFRSRAWWVRVCDFPRLQIAVGAVGVLALFWFINLGAEDPATWEWILFAALGAAVLAQSYQMLPYTPVWRAQVPSAEPTGTDGDRLRVVISNVCMRNRDLSRWLGVVRNADADLVIAVEVDAWWCDQLRVLHDEYPHRIIRPQDNTYGMALYSRLPLLRTEIKQLVEPDVPSVFLELALRSGRRVRCVALHPRPPRPDIQQDSDLRDAELVLAGKQIRQEDTPVLVAGDLNDVAWSHTTHLFQRIARLLDPRIGRGLFSTFHADHRFMRWPLDHVFHSKHFHVVEIRRLGHVGSDHFPILVELALQPAPPPEAKVDPPDRSDLEEAHEAVQEAREHRAEETPQERRERTRADL